MTVERAYVLPVETAAERGTWLPCDASTLLAGDTIRIRELVETGLTGDGVKVASKEHRHYRGRDRTVNRRRMKITTAVVYRVIENFLYMTLLTIDDEAVDPASKAFRSRLKRVAKRDHLIEISRDTTAGHADRAVDAVAHSVLVNCGRFLGLVDKAGAAGISIDDLQDAVFELPDEARYGDPAPTSDDLDDVFAGRVEPRPWIWKVVELAAADPARFNSVYA